MPAFIPMLPMATTVAAIVFAAVIARHWLQKRQAVHLVWWAVGMFCYAAGALTESVTTLFGWSEPVFRAWYVLGALLGAAPLAQGTVYLLLKKSTANALTMILVPTIVTAAICVFLTPIDSSKVEGHRLTGKVMAWQWVRYFSPFINLYAVSFLVGGAVYSAWRYWKEQGSRNRFVGNLLIAAGALLPGIGGTLTRFGRTEWLYVTELIALFPIWMGYTMIKNDPGASLHPPQASRVHGVGHVA
jgi:hypothetical protein